MGQTHTTTRGLGEPLAAPYLAPCMAVCLALLAGTLPACRPGKHDPSRLEPMAVEKVIGEVGLSPGQLASPRCIEHDQSTLWVIDKEARVQRLDPATGDCLAIFKMPEYAFGKPTGLTIVPEPGRSETNLMFIADTHYHRVRIYRVPVARPTGPISDTEPELVAQFGGFGREGGQFIFPTDIAVLRDKSGGIERIYVSEYGGNDRISVFDKDLKFQWAFGKFGAGDGGPAEVEFSRPQSMAIDDVRRELVVTDACNHRVGVFTLDGKLVRWLGGSQGADDAPGTFAYPYGLVRAGEGAVIVSEYGNGRSQMIDTRTGACLALFSGTRLKDGTTERLGNAWGVTILGDRVYTLDMLRSRIVSHHLPKLTGSDGGGGLH